MGVKERLREFIKFKKISERAFCSRIGVSNSYVNSIRTSIQPDKMKAIANEFPELNPMWLLTGDGEMLYSGNTNQISGNGNTAVRDVFCFCCFTGLRYSDVAKLKKSDVKKGYITVITQKTVDSLIIELNKYSKAILKKYENVGLPNDMALPVVSNVKMNENLKEMGKEAGLITPQRIVYFMGNQRHEEVLPKYALLTTHCGRRTFIVNALRLGVPAEVIMKWTGHSDYKAMKPYIKIVDKLKASEMEKFNNFKVQEKKENEPKKGKPKKEPNS